MAGRLSWAAGVVKGRRVFLRHIFNKISSLQHASHRSIISCEVRNDLLWWFSFLKTFNGRSVVLDKQPIHVFILMHAMRQLAVALGQIAFTSIGVETSLLLQPST